MTAAEQIDLDSVLAWMNAQHVGSGPLTDAERLTGGTQNILLRFRRGDDTFVLRRPPAHKRANSDETMRREARVLEALAGTDVPHPRLIRACNDETVIGAVFYLMEAIDGFNVCEGLAEHISGDLDAQRDMGNSMVDAIASLGSVDYRAVGLGEFGRAGGWLERQVPRWLSYLTSFERTPGYTATEVPHVAAVGEWLSDRLPPKSTPGIIHGDVHFGNVLVRRDAPVLAALVDWELATIGDPMLDLGHMLMLWPRPDNRGALWVGPDIPGLPSAPELIERYAVGSQRDVSSILWYCVLACFRLGIILEGTYARSLAGLADRETGEALHASALALFDRAHQLIHGHVTLDDL